MAVCPWWWSVAFFLLHCLNRTEAKVEHRVKIKLKDTDFDDSPQFRKEFKVRNDALLAKGGIPNQEKSEDVLDEEI